jgi:sugar-phosphatase
MLLMPIAVTARVLLLDLDGTLVDTTAAVEATWRAAAAELGVAFSTLASFIHGVPADQALATALPALPASTRAAVAERLQAQQAAAEQPATLLPGAPHLLEQLPGHSWAIVTSGGGRLAAASMAKAGIPDPPVLVTADDVTHGKPDPAPYLAAAARLGVHPRDCLAVEDAPAGVAAGRAAAMRVLAVETTHPGRALEGADWVIPDLTAVVLHVHGPGFMPQLKQHHSRLRAGAQAAREAN